MVMSMDRLGEGAGPQCRILVAAVGGGACSVLDQVRREWADPPPMAAVNTDAAALEAVDMPHKVLIGRTIAKGMGVGGDAELGRQAANEDEDALRALVADYDLLIMMASLGGGTATGAAPVLARLAQEEGLLTLAYVTTPFVFEGVRRQEQAQEGVAALKQKVDAVVCLPNQRLHTMLPENTPLAEAFGFTGRMMAAGIRGLWTLLSRDNMLNLDFSDLQTLVENSGNECSFGYGEGRGAGKAGQALKALLEGPMLEQGRVIANSGAMLLSVTGGPDLSLSELEQIHRGFQEAARPGAYITMGAAVLPDWEGRLALTVLAAEHWMPAKRKSREPGQDSLFDPPGGAPAGETARGKRRGGRKETPPDSKGERFKGVESTVHDGVDLDIPTYVRRGIRIPS